MDGNNHPQYPYPNYYYYPQYYAQPVPPQPQIPQGDPSQALSSMVHQLQQQTQQRQAMGALAAASVSSILHNNSNSNDSANYYNNYYYAASNQRPIIQYDDITNKAATTATDSAAAAATTTTAAAVDPVPEKPKLCCNRWLKSAIAVAQHEKLHIKCPSCDHMCLPSALQEHEENFHGKERKEKKPSRPDGVIPPNAPRIETPEDLEAWIAARKKNWPSRANVERKEKEEAEKEARGELSGTKRGRNPRHTTTSNNERQPKRQKTVNEASLVAQYDSNSDNDDSDSDIMDPEKDAISSKDPAAVGKILLPEDRPRRLCRFFASGNCKHGDACTYSHVKPEPRPKQPKQPRAAPVVKKRPNLLFKLLEKDIKQEKSVILQCLRYIVDNDFFGKENKVESGVTPVTEQEDTKSSETVENSMDIEDEAASTATEDDSTVLPVEEVQTIVEKDDSIVLPAEEVQTATEDESTTPPVEETQMIVEVQTTTVETQTTVEEAQATMEEAQATMEDVQVTTEETQAEVVEEAQAAAEEETQTIREQAQPPAEETQAIAEQVQTIADSSNSDSVQTADLSQNKDD